MTITQAEAQQALADIASTEIRGRTERAYRASSDILFLWGLVWIVAYSATGLLPPVQWGYVWVPADLIGIAGTIYLSRRAGRSERGSRAAIIAVAAFAFIGALFAIDPPHTQTQFEAVPPLMVAFLYILLGAIGLRRFIAIGAVLGVATVLGFFAAPQFFGFWMAAVGGGALLLSGVWLRQG